MITRFNYKPPKKRDSSHDDEFSKYRYEEKIVVISTQKDGSVDKYVKKTVWVEDKNSWKEFMKSFDLGTVSDQMLSHLSKGTPLVTTHVLPPADYTKIGKGAEIKREMAEKGVSLEMVVQAVKEAMQPKVQEKKVEVNTNEQTNEKK